MAQTSAGAPESREIRVFLSSTFRDFMEERELLAKQVFPELNRRARERGVELVEVDLRWGVTTNAGRFALRRDRRGDAVVAFVYGRRYRERLDALELDPVERRLSPEQYQTGRMGGFFGALRDSLTDFWGRQVIERTASSALTQASNCNRRGSAGSTRGLTTRTPRQQKPAWRSSVSISREPPSAATLSTSASQLAS